MFGNIFDDHKEIDRLAVQNRLLKEYELPVYQRLMEGRRGLRVLDVGCNNGSKTADRFAHPSVEKIIGLEYNQDLVEEAQATYGDRWFSFYQCDVEQPDFAPKLRGWMAENQVEAFDLIHISLVLMHLAEPGRILGVLREFLDPDGQVMIIEANDAVNQLAPDPDGLFQEFMEILMRDPFSGDRNFVNTIPALLEEQGYGRIALENETMGAAGHEDGKKASMFDTFFSYLPEDVALLRQREPDTPLYAQWEAWLDQRYAALRRTVLSGSSSITLGLSIYTAAKGRGPLGVQRLTEEYLDRVTELCARCVGENLYPRSYIASIIHNPDHYFSLLLSREGEIAGYIYFHLCTLEEAAAEAKLSRGELSVIAPAEHPVVAKFQSIGVAPPYRHLGLARRLVELALGQAREARADAAMCIAWKVGDRVPMGDNVLSCGFRYLTDSHLVWYDKENLVCPYCGGRCRCDAAIFYKTLESGEST